VPSSTWFPNYDVSRDGRFLMVQPSAHEKATPTQIIVVLNWFEELKRLAPHPRREIATASASPSSATSPLRKWRWTRRSSAIARRWQNYFARDSKHLAITPTRRQPMRR
jgi:hypothetical protein